MAGGWQISLIEPANTLTFPVGVGAWTISTPADSHGDSIPVAASGGWLDDRTLRTKVSSWRPLTGWTSNAPCRAGLPRPSGAIRPWARTSCTTCTAQAETRRVIFGRRACVRPSCGNPAFTSGSLGRNDVVRGPSGTPRRRSPVVRTKSPEDRDKPCRCSRTPQEGALGRARTRPPSAGTACPAGSFLAVGCDQSSVPPCRRPRIIGGASRRLIRGHATLAVHRVLLRVRSYPCPPRFRAGTGPGPAGGHRGAAPGYARASRPRGTPRA